MAISAHVQIKCPVTETISGDALAGDASVVHNQFDLSTTINASSAVPATKHAGNIHTLSGGALSVDFRSLTGLNGEAIDANGLKPQFMRIRNLGTGNLTVAKGASNGYTGFGSSFSAVIPPGGELAFYTAEGAADVSNTVKTLDFSGTGTETFRLQVVFG